MLNHLNVEIMTAYAAIQSTLEQNKACETLEQEVAYMVAGGKLRIDLNTLASSQTGWLIDQLSGDCIEEELITVFPEDDKLPREQSLNATLYTVASYTVLMDGYTSAKIIATSLENWYEQDNPTCEELDWEAVATKIVTQFIADGILQDKEDSGRMPDGAYFMAYPASQVVLAHRFNTLHALWNKAQPKMMPMKHKVTWQADGTCELPNLRLTCKGTQAYIDVFNQYGHTGYTINNKIRLAILEKLECGLYSIEDELAMEALIQLQPNTTYYIPHTDDYRGRAYARGGLTTPQGVKDMRAAFDFADSRAVDEEGLCIHIANACGEDKLSIVNRVQWVKDNIQDLISNPPRALYAQRAVNAYVEYMTTGKTNIICRIDGTCSGIQITSGLYLDAKTGKAVNVTPSSATDVPADIYGIVAEAALTIAKGAEKKIIQKYMRDITKKLIMILAYGAGQTTRIKSIEEFLSDNNDKGNSKRLEKVIMTAINIVASSVTKLNKNLQRILKASPTHRINYELSDVELTFKNFDSEHLNIYGSAYSTKLKGKKNKDTAGFARGLAPNFVHSLDSELLRIASRKLNKDISPIHDDIGCHSCDMHAALKAVREAYIEVIAAEPLETLYNQLGATYLRQDNGLVLADVVKSAYLFS